MGVSGFYKHLIQTYPELTNALEKLREMKKIFLYLDFNGEIHCSIRRVLKRYQNKDNIDRKKMELEMFQEVKRDTNDILNKINPDFLMIAVDGVAPRAKMQQQRLRRYKSVIENNDIRKIFDTNSISPGTLFMKRLTEYMKKYIKEEVEKKCKVLFLDASIPGEGEHKIIQFIKKFKINE